MAKFRQVYTEFWEDPKVQEEFTPEDRYFYLYLLTNPRTTQIGIYQITKKQIAFELGYSTESINALIDRFENHHKLIKYNLETREIAIKNWGRYNFNKAGKPVEDCVRSELSRVKDNDLIEYTKPNIDNSKIINIYDTYTIRGTTGGQEKEEEKEEEENKKKNKNRREKEVIAFDFYQENGFGLLNPHIKDEMGSYIDDFENDGNEIVTKALKITLERNKISWGYTKGILKNWLQANLKNMDQIEAYEKSRVITRNAGQHETSEINNGKIYTDLKTTNDMTKEEIDQIFGGE
ncbi:DnaD domain protein [Staphylococcus schleiferi]|nr:DnaD domain protein [Staphylococcus schleiferi]